LGVVGLLATYRWMATSSAVFFIWIYINRFQTHVPELCLSAVWCGSFQRMILLQLYLNYCCFLCLKCVPIRWCSVLIWNGRLAGYKSNVLCTILLGIWLALTQVRHPIFWAPYTDGKQVMWKMYHCCQNLKLTRMLWLSYLMRIIVHNFV